MAGISRDKITPRMPRICVSWAWPREKRAIIKDCMILRWGIIILGSWCLTDCGLNPKSFDLGFGFGRTMIPLVKFLEKGNYIGSEISKERHRIATEWLELEGLGNSEAQLILALDNEFEFIKNRSLDFVWAQSVFTHLPEGELTSILMRLKSKLKQTGCVVFNFTVSKSYGNERSSIKDFKYAPEKIDEIAARMGYAIQYLDDWQASIDEKTRATHNKMVKLTITRR